MLSKTDLRVQMDAKSNQLKHETKNEPFSAPADTQESADRITIKAFEVHVMTQFWAHLIIHLDLHLKMPFKIYIKMYKKVQLRVTDETQVAIELHLSM